VAWPQVLNRTLEEVGDQRAGPVSGQVLTYTDIDYVTWRVEKKDQTLA
jgi:hypothetical protein